MIATQKPNLFGHRFRYARVHAGVLGHLALQGADWILGVTSDVEPSLDGFGAKPHHLVGARVTPGFRRQLGDTRGELA